MQPIREFLAHLSAERGLSQNTVASYRRDLAGFEKHLLDRNGRDLLSADRRDIASFLARETARGMRWATVSRRLATLRSFYKFLAAEGIVPESPARDVPMPRRGARLPSVLRPAETERLLGGSGEGEETSARDEAILEVFYACGLRVSELAGLRRGDVNFRFGFVKVRGKGGKERIVPLGRPASRALTAYLETSATARKGMAPDKEPLFLSRKGGPLSRSALYRRVRRAASRRGLSRRVGPHTLRHSFASHLVAGGADLRTVQELLGHSSVATTQVYTHVENRWLKDLHGKFHPRA